MNTLRNNTLSKISMIFENKVSENIEKSIYNYSIRYANSHNIPPSWESYKFEKVYKVKSFYILNLCQTDKIREQINNKTIKGKDLATFQDCETFKEEEVEDGIFQCKKCGSQKTTFYSLQTRSADEPMTNFITCVECKNRWKM